MKTKFKFSAAVVSLALSAGTSASTITIETGFSAAGSQIDAAAYQSVVNAAIAIPSAGYGAATVAIYDNISNQSLFLGGSSTDIAFKSTVDFTYPQQMLAHGKFVQALILVTAALFLSMA